MHRSAIAFGVAGLFVASAQAEVLYSWEEDPQGWGAPAGYSTTANTHGDHAIVYDIPSGGWNNIQGGYGDGATLIPILAENNLLQLDVTPLHALEEWENLQISLYLQGGNTVGGGWSHSPGGTFQTITHEDNGSTVTIELDYSHLPVEVGNTGWVQFRIITQANGGYSGQVAFDNYRAVPEPASLALAGLGGLAMLMRRRQA